MEQKPQINPFGIAMVLSCLLLLCSPVLAFFNASPHINLTLTQILAPTAFAIVLLLTTFVICLAYELLKKE